MSASMTSMDRVVTTLGHREPDRVPVFLLLTMHGAKELDLPLQAYFSQPDRMVEGQLRMRRRFGHDCLYGITYAAAEHQAFGGEVIFSDEGPPNAGAPVIRRREDIFALEPPDVASVPVLRRGLELIRGLAEAADGEVPIVGSAVGPASLPVMLMGFGPYLELMHEDRPAFDRLMAVTSRFCVDWANAQFAAGATAVGYFDPLSAVDVTERGLFEEQVLPVARDTIPRFTGPAALHLASGRALSRIDAYASTGAAGLGVSTFEDLAELKQAARGRLALMGNLNGILMARWTPEEAAAAVREAIRKGGPGGGFILADNHGEIPFDVPDDVLLTITETVRTDGTYPIAVPDHG